MAQRIVRPPSAFSLDPSRKGQKGRREDPDHLAFIRGLPCLVTGTRKAIEAAHVRYADPSAAKPGTPLGRKPDDRWTVPLCADAHRTGPDAQHRSGEREWWTARGIDPVAVAIRLYRASGDQEAGEAIVAAAREAAR